MKRVGLAMRDARGNRAMSVIDRINGWMCPPKQLPS